MITTSLRRRVREGRTIRGRAAGFSLLEALTVIVIILILTSSAVALYGGYRRALRTKTVTRQIETLFSTARALSINQNAHFQAVLDLRTSGLWIDQVDSDGNIVVPKLTTPDNWSVFVAIRDISVNGNPVVDSLARIRFHPDGTSDAAQMVLREAGAGAVSGVELLLRLYSPTGRSRAYPVVAPPAGERSRTVEPHGETR